ncbi:ABC-type nitrate/sulfonate/bicarbonate transport system permease component [Bradyrhizobium sp. GM2.4]
MTSLTALAKRTAPVFACIGLLAAWQVASLALKNDSFPTAIEAIRAIPDILGDKEALINILASLRRMAVGFGIAVSVSIPLGLLMGRSRGRRGLLQSAPDGDLSGAEGRLDADHHAVARRW